VPPDALARKEGPDWRGAAAAATVKVVSVRVEGGRMMQAPRFEGLGAVLALSVTLAAAGCAAGPQSPPPDTTASTLSVGFRDYDNRTAIDLRHQAGVGETTVPAGVAAVWGILPAIFEQLEIDVTHVDASAGEMGNPGYRARRVGGERMSRWLDCGRSLVRANADEYEVRLAVVVQLLGAENGTRVRTTVDAYARDRSVSGGSVHCLSWGHLERRIGELVMERLEA
jgi:hypothetical protein